MMRWKLNHIVLLGAALVFSACAGVQRGGGLYTYEKGVTPRWASPENPVGEKGKGASSNFGAKGRAFTNIPAGGSLELMRVTGTAGKIGRMWITINDRSPEMLRSLKLEMFWDGADKAAVSSPLGDFFGAGLGRMTPFHNALFADPEGRSFVCYIPMPFRTGARVVVTNESAVELPYIFYDVDYQLTDSWDKDNLYFHAYWHRDTATRLAQDFELLPAVAGKGRFLGVNVGVNSNPVYGDLWWGEGEVKMYLDGDQAQPTLAGTGTEDYIGTAWGQGAFATDYSGCLIADGPKGQWGWYRYHIPDPVFFASGCRVTLQQIGGGPADKVSALQQRHVALTPVTVDNHGKIKQLYSPDSVATARPYERTDGWINFYRTDDVSATSYFYLDKPVNVLPSLQPASVRRYKL